MLLMVMPMPMLEEGEKEVVVFPRRLLKVMMVMVEGILWLLKLSTLPELVVAALELVWKSSSSGVVVGVLPTPELDWVCFASRCLPVWRRTRRHIRRRT